VKTDEPRPEQVAELTKGIKLPLPALDDEYLLIIAESLAKAWGQLLNRPNNKLIEKDEPYITALLEARLIHMRDEDPLWEMLVSSVSRGREMISFDGSHLEKRPDLSLTLTQNNRAGFPLIIECKILETKSKPVGLYCKNGLRRFKIGEYAWYDRQAFMLAYVRDNSRIATTLRPYLAEHQEKSPDVFDSEQLPEAVEPLEKKDIDLARSRHRRKFQYNESRQPNKPGPIVIWHFWASLQD
jgi:hypothetical protein